MSRKVLVPLVLPADPTNPLEAVTKQYVDALPSSDEVWVGPEEPTDPGMELWYDTDATAGAAEMAQMQLWTWEGPAVTRYGATQMSLATGQVSTNAQPSLATEMYVSRLDATGMIDWSRPIEEAVIGDLIYLQHAPESASWHLYRITGTPTVAADGVWTIPVTTDSGSAPGTAPPTGDLVYIIFPSVYTDTRYVNVAGDTMTAPLTLPAADPTAADHAARKAYVDTQVATRLTQAAADTRYVDTSGDTMSGGLVVSAGGITGNRVDSDGPITAQASISTPAGTVSGGGDSVTAAGWQATSSGIIRTLLDSTGVGAPNLRVARGGTAGGTNEDLIQFIRRASSVDTTIGTIRIASGTTVAYNTSSDPSRKRRVGPLTDALSRVRRLARRAYRGQWKADDEDAPVWDFVNGDDIACVAPYATSYDGQWWVDYSKLVPLLLAAVGDLADRVDALTKEP